MYIMKTYDIILCSYSKLNSSEIHRDFNIVLDYNIDVFTKKIVTSFFILMDRSVLYVYQLFN